MFSVQPNFDAADHLLDGITRRLDADIGLRSILGDLLTDYEKQVFTTRDTGRWAPLGPATVKAKNSGRVLVDTGGLLSAMTHPERTTDGVRVNAGWPFGNLKSGARGMPKRDPAPRPSSMIIGTWSERVLDYLVKGTR